MNAMKSVRSDAAKAGSILSALKFSTAVKPTKQAVEQRKPVDVVVDAIREQIQIAKADIDGKDYTVARTRFQRQDGKSIKKSVTVTPRRAFWQQNGEWYGSLRYGNVTVLLDEAGNTSFVAGAKLSDVVNAYELMLRAVQAGELDAAVNAAAEKAKRTKGEAKAA